MGAEIVGTVVWLLLGLMASLAGLMVYEQKNNSSIKNVFLILLGTLCGGGTVIVIFVLVGIQVLRGKNGKRSND